MAVALKVEGPLDLRKSPILNFVVQSQATAPTTPVDGQFWWDSTNHQLFYYVSSTTTWYRALDTRTTTMAPTAHTHAASDVNSGVLDVARHGTTPTAGDYLKALGATGSPDWVAPSQIKTDLALVKGDVGLGNVANVDTTNASNITTGTLPTSVLPPLAVNEVFTAASQAAMLALSAQRGDMCIRTDTGKTYVLSTDSPSTLADWKEVMATGQVVSVAGKTGVVTLLKADVGLDQVDNTSDANKPVSTAQQTALNGKANTSHSHLIADLPVAPSGTSNTTQVVRADDARLSNARTPTTHAHAIADLPVAPSGTSNTTQVVRADDSRLSDTRTPSAHNHVKANITDLGTIGTAAAKDVPPSGDATTAQVVMGTDTRLTNARTPATHSHAIADLPVAASGTSNATQVVRADDSRLSNARTPTTHSHAEADLTGMASEAELATAVSNHAAAADPHTGYQKESEKSAANGYASLDSTTKVPAAELPGRVGILNAGSVSFVGAGSYNTITTPGTYAVGGGVTGGPWPTECLLKVDNWDATWVSQEVWIIYGSSAGPNYKMYRQYNDTAGWSAWQRMVDQPFADSSYARLTASNTLTGNNTFTGQNMFMFDHATSHVAELRNNTADPALLMHRPGTSWLRLKGTGTGLQVRSGDDLGWESLRAGAIYDTGTRVSTVDHVHGASSVAALVGEVTMWAGTTTPVGWLPCDGTSRLVADYPSLHAVIQYTYGGSGTSFNLPDLKDRFPRGVSTGLPGVKAGSDTHSHTVNSHSHTINEHTHGMGHDHGNTGAALGTTLDTVSVGGGQSLPRNAHYHGPTGTAKTSTDGASDRGTNAQTPGTNSPSNVPNYTSLNFIIRALPATQTSETGVNVVQRVIYAGGWPARPAGVNYVEWVGPTQPPNATVNDTWVNTTP